MTHNQLGPQSMFRNIATMSVVVGCVSDEEGPEVAPNMRPYVKIIEPEDGGSYQSDVPIEFIGQVEDRNGLADIDVLLWSSSIDGVLSDTDDIYFDDSLMLRFDTKISPGNHVVTLFVSDIGELEAEDSINVSVSNP